MMHSRSAWSLLDTFRYVSSLFTCSMIDLWWFPVKSYKHDMHSGERSPVFSSFFFFFKYLVHSMGSTKSLLNWPDTRRHI